MAGSRHPCRGLRADRRLTGERQQLQRALQRSGPLRVALLQCSEHGRCHLQLVGKRQPHRHRQPDLQRRVRRWNRVRRSSPCHGCGGVPPLGNGGVDADAHTHCQPHGDSDAHGNGDGDSDGHADGGHSGPRSGVGLEQLRVDGGGWDGSGGGAELHR